MVTTTTMYLALFFVLAVSKSIHVANGFAINQSLAGGSVGMTRENTNSMNYIQRRQHQQYDRNLLSSSSSSSSSSCLYMAPRSRGGGGASPDLDVKIKTTVETQIKQKVETVQKSKVEDQIIQSRSNDVEDAPMYKLYLISDDEYDPDHVIERMCNVLIEDMDEDRASTIYQQAMATGKAMCGKYPFERAELYKEQLMRSDPIIYSDLEQE